MAAKFSYLTLLIALSGLVGWAADFAWLTQWGFASVTMKPVTCVCFLTSAFGVLALTKGWRTLAFSAGSHTIIVMLATLFGFNAASVPILAEQPDLALESVAPGIPSLGTVFLFALLGGNICFRSLSTATHKDNSAVSKYIGQICVGLASVAISGHLFSIPSLYYYIPQISTGLARPTAFLFTIQGIAILKMNVPGDAD